MKQRRNQLNRSISAIIAGLSLAAAASGNVMVTTSLPDWQASVGAPITQLTFEGIGPAGSGFQNQYSALGVVDPEPNDSITFHVGRWYLSGFNLPVPPATITFQFSSPIHAVGWTAYADQTADLYLGGSLVASGVMMPGGAFPDWWPFSGLISDTAFDKVVITRPGPAGGVFAAVDDVWFQSVPSPPSILVGALALMIRRRRSA